MVDAYAIAEFVDQPQPVRGLVVPRLVGIAGDQKELVRQRVRIAEQGPAIVLDPDAILQMRIALADGKSRFAIDVQPRVRRQILDWPQRADIAAGVDFKNIQNVKMFNNVSFANGQGAFSMLYDIMTSASGVYKCNTIKLYNNSFYLINRLAPPGFWCFTDSTGCEANGNLYYSPSNDYYWVVGGSGKSSFAALQAAGYDLNSPPPQNPRFVVASPESSTDFQIQGLSPCRNNAIDATSYLTNFPGIDFFGNTVPGPY